ncbi:hypothetical protein IZU99_03155 [Oscillospiraceae bacterium CM]|nr:hypothetical protein IZU99_03155 [Oscillospiraceae bacterium CM]
MLLTYKSSAVGRAFVFVQRRWEGVPIKRRPLQDNPSTSVESIRQTYEKLIAEQQAANAENLAAENRVRDLTDVYRENVQTKGAGADTVSAQQVENSAGQGYNGINTLEKLYDEALNGKGVNGAGETGSGSNILIDTYKNMRNNPDVTGQAHHLNQNAAFRDVIPKNDGLSVELEGNAFKDVGSPHYSAHENLEGFWNNFRSQGDLYGDTPTISAYNSALYNSLRAAGLSDAQAKIAVQNAIKQQSQYGLVGDSFVPRIPGRINFRK